MTHLFIFSSVISCCLCEFLVCVSFNTRAIIFSKLTIELKQVWHFTIYSLAICLVKQKEKILRQMNKLIYVHSKSRECTSRSLESQEINSVYVLFSFYFVIHLAVVVVFLHYTRWASEHTASERKNKRNRVTC